MKQRFAASDPTLCDDSNFASHNMHQGDALVFYQDVPHYGPANPDVSVGETDESDARGWRWVLFAMFSPEDAPTRMSNRIY